MPEAGLRSVSYERNGERVDFMALGGGLYVCKAALAPNAANITDAMAQNMTIMECDRQLHCYGVMTGSLATIVGDFGKPQLCSVPIFAFRAGTASVQITKRQCNSREWALTLPGMTRWRGAEGTALGMADLRQYVSVVRGSHRAVYFKLHPIENLNELANALSACTSQLVT